MASPSQQRVTPATTRRRTPDASAARPSGARTRAVVGLLTATVLVSACATGPRPSFDAQEPELAATGDEAVDAVLERLDAVAIEEFTADYEILTRFGGLESTATVVQADNSRRSVTVNDVRFIDGTGTSATCDLVADECEAAINDARISDVSVTHDFYGSAFARRLRVDAGRRLAESEGYEVSVAGQSGVCADVPVSGGTVTYCALDAGPLARYDGADLAIDLVDYSPTPDETKFETS
jgi:hypothetical protein